MEAIQLEPLTIAIIAAAAGLIGVLAEGLKDVLTALLRRFARGLESDRDKRLYSDGIKRIAQFHDCLERLGAMSFVDRVLVFSGTNCGGVPDPKRAYIVKCFYGWTARKDIEPEKHYDFPLKVDSYCINSILRLLEKGFTVETTATMPATAQLRQYYELEGVVQSRLYQLHISSTELIYLSAASYAKEFLPAECREMDILVDRMRAVLRT